MLPCDSRIVWVGSFILGHIALSSLFSIAERCWPRWSPEAAGMFLAVSGFLLMLCGELLSRNFMNCQHPALSGGSPFAARRADSEANPCPDSISATNQGCTGTESFSSSALPLKRGWRPGCTKVLCVDAISGSIFVAASRLDNSEFDVRQTESAEQMLSMLYIEDKLPDIVVMAMELSYRGMSGLQAMRAVRHIWSGAQLPVIMVTDANIEEDVVNALDAGANDSISSPIRHQELKARIHTQLALQRGIVLAQEANKNLQLLQSILPADIIARLKTGSMVADFHPQVTFLFSDVKDFTTIAATWPTEKLINMLNELFTAFDDICTLHSVYKVETVGDAYMVVAQTQDHAYRMMGVAAAFLRVVESGLTRWHGDAPIQIRIGVHTGAAHSGVIGVTRPRYCFFGDSVNTASRMESTGFPGSVQVSEATYKAVQDWQEILLLAGDAPEWEFVSLGLRQVKGKGAMATYLLKLGKYEEALTEMRSTLPDTEAAGHPFGCSPRRICSTPHRVLPMTTQGSPLSSCTPSKPCRRPTESHLGNYACLELSNSRRTGKYSPDSELLDAELLPWLPQIKACHSSATLKSIQDSCPSSNCGSSHPPRRQLTDVTDMLRVRLQDSLLSSPARSQQLKQQAEDDSLSGTSTPAWPAGGSGSALLGTLHLADDKDGASSSYRDGVHDLSSIQGSLLDLKLNSLRDQHMQKLHTSSSTSTAHVDIITVRSAPASRYRNVSFVNSNSVETADGKTAGHGAARRRPSCSILLSGAMFDTPTQVGAERRRRHSMRSSLADSSQARAELELLALYDTLVGDLNQ